MQKEQALAERAGLKVHVSLWELPTVRRFRHTIDTERQNPSDYPVPSNFVDRFNGVRTQNLANSEVPSA
jgi:hypothetical protein